MTQQNLVVYKLTIEEFFYFGSTDNFNRRKYKHKKDCFKRRGRGFRNKCKKYTTIRGLITETEWNDNINMEVIEQGFDNVLEMKLKEDEYIKEYLGDDDCLNSNRVCLTQQEKKEYNTNKKREERLRNLETNKHRCECCDISFGDLFGLKQHQSKKYHLENIREEEEMDDLDDLSNEEILEFINIMRTNIGTQTEQITINLTINI